MKLEDTAQCQRETWAGGVDHLMNCLSRVDTDDRRRSTKVSARHALTVIQRDSFVAGVATDFFWHRIRLNGRPMQRQAVLRLHALPRIPIICRVEVIFVVLLESYREIFIALTNAKLFQHLTVVPCHITPPSPG